MSKHMKKLISTLLCGAMLLSSMSLSAFAEGTDAAAATAAPAATASPEASAAEATAAPEASATPEATAAPEATAVPASNDDYFNEAIGLLSALKIFEGYEDGSIKPESTITRAEMAAVILRTLGNRSLTKYTGMFTDVAADHWAADTIQTAADLGIINGMGDGTFAPDAPVKYEQAVKMAVCALNYGAYADYNGGYPMGYLTLANRSDLKITKSIGGALGQDATRGTIVKLIYNSLNAPYPTLTGLDAQGPIYSTADDKTLASEKHKVYISKGILTATHNKSIDVGADLTETQISIDGDVFESTITNADDLVGQYVKSYYYDPTGNGGEETIIYSTPVLNKNNTLVIDALKIDEIDGIYSGAPKVKYYSSTNSRKTANLVENPIIVYNNEVLTTDKMPVDASDESAVEKFITPDVGLVKLGDFNDDGKYDILFVEKYVTIVVNSASETKVTFKYAIDGHKNIDMDMDDSKYKIDIKRDGDTIKTRHLKEYNVMSVLMNAPYFSESYTGDKKIKAVVTTTTMTGIPTSYNEDDDGNYITTINGKEYYVDKNAVDDLASAIGTDSTFYLDQFDRIAYVDKAGGGKLSGSEKYGWIMNVFTDYGDDTPSIKMYTQDGASETYEVDSTISYADKETDGTTINLDTTTAKGKERLMGLKTVGGYETVAGGLAGISIRLCKYRVNSNGLITRLYVASSKMTNDNIVQVDKNNQNGQYSTGSILSGYKLEGDVLQFEVPNTEADMTDPSSYKVGNVASSIYLNYANGCGDDIILAEFDKNKPTVIVKYVGSADAPKNADDYNTADDNSVMLVSKVLAAVNEDDETVYVVKGYISGSEVEFTTKTTSVLREMAESQSRNGDDKKHYQGPDVWNGKSGADLRDYLKKGDICGVSGGDIFIKMANIEKINVADGTVGSGQFNGEIKYSETRDNVLMGFVKDVVTDTSAVVTFASGSMREIALDTSIACVEVKKNGSVDIKNDTISVFDVEEGDFMFVRLFKNGAQREVYVIRKAD